MKIAKRSSMFSVVLPETGQKREGEEREEEIQRKNNSGN